MNDREARDAFRQLIRTAQLETPASDEVKDAVMQEHRKAQLHFGKKWEQQFARVALEEIGCSWTARVLIALGTSRAGMRILEGIAKRMGLDWPP